jgi:hypothetical protein
MEEFWCSTPDELGAVLDGVARSRRDLADILLVTVWQQVALDRTKRLPDLQRLLDRRREREEAEAVLLTKEQVVAKWKAFFDRARKTS